MEELFRPVKSDPVTFRLCSDNFEKIVTIQNTFNCSRTQVLNKLIALGLQDIDFLDCDV